MGMTVSLTLVLLLLDAMTSCLTTAVIVERALVERTATFSALMVIVVTTAPLMSVVTPASPILVLENSQLAVVMASLITPAIASLDMEEKTVKLPAHVGIPVEIVSVISVVIHVYPTPAIHCSP